MCHNGDTCLPENVWFIEQALLHSWSVYLFMVRVIVFNTTFNNISVISWQSVLLVEKTGVPGENHQPVASH